MYVGRDFDVCDPGEVEVYAFDFTNDLYPGDSIVGATWTCTVDQGTDGSPSARLKGSPWFVSSTQTAQVLQGGVAGTSYIIQAVVTTQLGYTVSLYSHSRCEVIT